MSVPELRSISQISAGVALGRCRVDVTELAVRRGRAADFHAIAARRGVALPPSGRLVATSGALALSVRPERWLLLAAPEPAGAIATEWQSLAAGVAATVDQSSALVAFYLEGRHARDVLARGCRLDLDPEIFPPGHAAATTMAQVATILAGLPAGMLILTPATTARHLREWLGTTAGPFGLAPFTDISLATLSGQTAS